MSTEPGSNGFGVSAQDHARRSYRPTPRARLRRTEHRLRYRRTEFQECAPSAGGAASGPKVEQKRPSGRGAAAANLGRRHPRPQEILGARTRALRRAGLSRQKIGYMRDLATRAHDGLPLRGLGRRSDDEVIEALCAVKGIGR